jgi:tRNA A-37 threonylcarbamoyl transferase component Bud32
MLSATDSELIRRDPEIAGMAVVLDRDALLAELRRCLPQADFQGARITDLKYRPGSKCLVSYLLDVPGATVEFYAKARQSRVGHGQGREPQFTLDPPGPLGPSQIVWKDLGISIAFFPYDQKLPGLHSLRDAASRRELLREIIPDRPDFWDGTVETIRWRPERRFVGQLVANQRVQAALKFRGPSKYAASRASALSFTSRGILSIPRAIAHSGRHGVVVLEWLAGRVLRTMYPDPGLDLRVADVGRALATLHAQTPAGLARRTRPAEVHVITLSASAIGFLCPRLAPLADDVARRLARHVSDLPSLDTPIHGDFTPKQVILADSAVGIIDLDEAVRGDPAIDLGKFVAHLERDAVCGELPSSRVEPLTNAFLSGYESQSNGLISERVALYSAVGLLRMALQPFRFREPDWPERTEAILEQSARILDQFERNSPR